MRIDRPYPAAGIEGAQPGYVEEGKGGAHMGLVVLLIVLALVAGGVGLLVEGLTWLLIIAAVLFLFGIFTGYRGRTGV
jgi:hypothetical protein